MPQKFSVGGWIPSKHRVSSDSISELELQMELESSLTIISLQLTNTKFINFGNDITYKSISDLIVKVKC